MNTDGPHTVAIEEDGDIKELKGVAYAEQGTRARDNTSGVHIVYADTGESKPAKSEFVTDATIVGTYSHDVWPDEEERPEWARNSENNE